MSQQANRTGPGRLKRYDPPGGLKDFDGIPGQLEDWSRAVSGWFDETIELELKRLDHKQPCQYINQLKTDPIGPTLAQDIVWTGLTSGGMSEPSCCGAVSELWSTRCCGRERRMAHQPTKLCEDSCARLRNLCATAHSASISAAWSFRTLTPHAPPTPSRRRWYSGRCRRGRDPAR